MSIKLVVVGDGAVGKTSLLISYTERKFPQQYIPTVFENYETRREQQGRVFTLKMWDTAGQEEYDHIRPLSYPETDVFLVCFSVVDENSLVNVKEKWIPEIKAEDENVMFFLVGTKSDLRENGETIDGNMIPEEDELEQKAQEYGAAGYLECSAKTMYNVDQLFDTVVNAVIKAKPEVLDVKPDFEEPVNARQTTPPQKLAQAQAQGGGGCCTIL